MDSLVFSLLIVSAICHASWNAVAKSSDDPWVSMAIGNSIRGIICFFLLFVFPIPTAESWPYLLASALAHMFYYVGVSLGYRLGDLSQVYPIQRGIAPLLIVFGAYVFAGEVVSVQGFLGIFIISTSILGLTLTKNRELNNKKATWCALFTGTMIATYTIFDGLGGRLSGNVFGYIVWLFFLDGIPFSLAVFYIRRKSIKQVFKQEIKAGFGVGILGSFAYATAIWALTFAPIAYVSALRETSVIIAVWIGCRLLKEPFGFKRIVVAVFITLGVFFLQSS